MKLGTVMQAADIARATPQPPPGKTITFRNNVTGATITVNDCEATRALAARGRLPRAQRRAQEKGARKLLKKTRKALRGPA